MIKVIPCNETYIRIETDDYGIEQEISEYFTFMAPGYRFMPSYKNKMWDGKIRLFNMRNKQLYKGLIHEIIKFAKNRDYELFIDKSLKNSNALEVTYEKAKDFVDSLDLHGRGDKLDIREYQYEAVWQAISNERQLLLSPTASGKSMIIMCIIRWHIEHGRKLMIVVPTTMLVEQLFSDFEDYSSENGWNAEEHCSTLYSGKERVFEKSVVISTWQSLASMMKNDPKKFDEIVKRTEVGIWDECLAGDSLIELENNIFKKIKEINVGDMVKTINETTLNVEYKPVIKLHKNISTEQKYKIKLKNGKFLEVTGNHKIMTASGWVRVDELTINSKIRIS
jgi:hypothetical protein